MGVTYSFFDTDDKSERIRRIIKILKPKKIFTFSKKGIKGEYLLNKKIFNLKNKPIKTKFTSVKDLVDLLLFTSARLHFY